jgi:hypothetical protein
MHSFNAPHNHHERSSTTPIYSGRLYMRWSSCLRCCTSPCSLYLLTSIDANTISFCGRSLCRIQQKWPKLDSSLMQSCKPVARRYIQVLSTFFIAHGRMKASEEYNEDCSLLCVFVSIDGCAPLTLVFFRSISTKYVSCCYILVPLC